MEQVQVETELETQESIPTADILSSPMKKRKTADTCMEEAKSWADFPCNVLERIAKRLSLVELIHFQSVCKDWKLASSTASAECEYTDNKRPWFLLYNKNDTSHCRLYQPSSEKVHVINIPELNKMNCIASKGGWLLLVREDSLFFFCPFSRARIDLPVMLPHPERSDHVATFTSPPTAPDCVVCVINNPDGRKVEINTLTRGVGEWDTYTTEHDSKVETITSATYWEGTFHFLGKGNLLLEFEMTSCVLKRFNLICGGDRGGDKNTPQLPFYNNKQYFNEYGMKEKLGLGRGHSVSICGTDMPYKTCSLAIQNEDIDDEMVQSDQSTVYKGVWIHPRFFQLPQNQSWSL